MYPLTPHCSLKLMMQEQTHSMRLRSSVIRTQLLGGDRDLMAEGTAEASAERGTQSGWVRVKGMRVCVWGTSGYLAVSPFCRLTEFKFACVFEVFSLQESLLYKLS